MERTKATYQIPMGNWGKFEAKIERVNRKAAKLGIEPVAVTVVRDFQKRVDDVRTRAYREVEVEGAAPRINGWTFVATLQHLGEDGNIVRAIPGAEIPASFRAQAPVCDHCRKPRNRIDTYVLQSDAGEHKQVGSNCLGDFLGALDPHAMASWCELLGGLDSGAEGHRRALDDGDYDPSEYGSAGRADYRYDLATYLACVALAVEESGWLSRTAARNGARLGAPTADVAYGIMCPDPKSDEPRRVPTDAHRELAVKALAWARETLPAKKDLSDYEYNMMVVTRHDDIDTRMFGLAASLVQMYSRAMEREIEYRRRAASESGSQFVGTEKRREAFTLTVSRITPLEGNYGVTHLHKFLDQAGNVVVWFATNAGVVPFKWADGSTQYKEMEVGKTYVLKGTVKRHEEYKGIKQTTLSRCKVESQVEEAK